MKTKKMTCRPDSKIYAEAPTKEIKKEIYNGNEI